MLRIISLSLILVFIAGCSGQSTAELRRLQMLEAQRAEEATREAQKLAAERDTRIQTRLNDAHNAWENDRNLTSIDITSLFENHGAQLTAGKTYFVEFELQAARYNYGEDKQSFTIVGMRNLPSSKVYSPIFPDENALYQPGQKAKSVLEFTLRDEKEENQMAQLVEREDGQRWVAAVLNFKDYESLVTLQNSWRWEPGLFDDISWHVPPEVAYPQTSSRSLSMQIGFRFCPLDRCYLDSNYRKHAIHGVRADVISIAIGNRDTDNILAEFVRDAL